MAETIKIAVCDDEKIIGLTLFRSSKSRAGSVISKDWQELGSMGK